MTTCVFLSLVILSLGRLAEFQPQSEKQQEHFDGNVIFSSIVFALGTRNEIQVFPDDEPNVKDRLKSGLDQVAKQRAYQLSQWARARYSNLLKTKSYNPDFFAVASSDVEQTVSYAQSFLGGFSTSEFDSQKQSDNFTGQSLIVYTVSTYGDEVNPMATKCPRYNLELIRIKDGAGMKQFCEKYEDFFRYVEDCVGVKIPKYDALLAMSKLKELYDNILVRETLGMPRPNWCLQMSCFELLKTIMKLHFQMFTYNDTTKRLKGGPLIDHIIRGMVNKRYANDYANKILQVYFGHDTTLVVLLNTLGIYDTADPPPFGAAVIIELRYKEDEKEYFVTILYRKSDDQIPVLLKSPKCENPCTLTSFIAATESLISKDLRKECDDIPTDQADVLQTDYNSIFF